MDDTKTKQPLGRILVDKGVISEDQLRIALQEQSKSHQAAGHLLVGLGFLSEATIAMCCRKIWARKASISPLSSSTLRHWH